MKPLSARRRGSQSPGCLVLFFGIFLAVGCVLSYFILWKPWSGWLAARFWEETPCRIVSSQVAEISDSDGSTYKVDITYAYAVEGGEIRGSSYDFTNMSSSGYDGKAAIVARYPPGTQTTCWINPKNRTESVLSRDFSLSYLVGLFPLIFVAAGAGGITWALRLGRKNPKDMQGTAAVGSPFGVEIPADAAQPRVLRPQLSPVGKLVGLIFVALFWNGIVSIFVFFAVDGWRSGHPEGCLIAFLVPFVLIGLGLIFGVFRQFLVLFNPRLELTLSRGTLVPGDPALLQWKIEGKAERVKRLKIVLEGCEEATYRQGTDTKTDREVFATIPVVDTDPSMQMAQGSARVQVPEDAMPSFKADRNKVVWKLKAACEIPGWPDSDDEYEIVVAPAALR
ncbi:MAG TPA: DUF3592 domain-containing protein [Thermoanaerobaculia bacterium]|nr:DUF3592 domain-containing protein [Thermoanaerobaculia bacterium]